MVLQNICFLLQQFIRCSAYQNIVFCWVLHKQDIIDQIVASIDPSVCSIKVISLICDQAELKNRLMKDITAKIRTKDVIKRSIARMDHYMALHTVKINTTGKQPAEIADEIIARSV